MLLALALLDVFHLHRSPAVAIMYLVQQDIPLLVGAALLLPLLARTNPPAITRDVRPPRRWVLVLALTATMVAYLGTRFVFLGYALSGDEVMADFDARIFRAGHLFARLPEAWRPYAEALQPIFVMIFPGHVAWASTYLPVNAAFRALGALVGAADLVNPLWTGGAVIATAAAARRIWPDRPATALISALLLATSSQVLVAGMSAYAMPAHLALNMVWLWCFLRGGRAGHAGALLCAFLATGLHQLVFHPLFAAPFVLQLWLERRWRAAWLYTLGYGLITGFWLCYWPMALSLSHISAGAGGDGGPAWFAARVAWLLARFDPLNAGAMALDLTRFLVWQHPFTIPLAVLGLGGALRAKGVLRSLALSVLLTVAAVFVLLPYQDHGWGYRYLHGELGAVCLLAAWTWQDRTGRMPQADRRAAAVSFAVATLAAAFIIAPSCIWQAGRYVRPYAAASAAIARTDADLVIVDDAGSWYTETLVRNDPGLEGRPLVMKLDRLDDGALRGLCATHTVAIFDRHAAARLGIAAAKADDPGRTRITGRLRRLMAGLGCGGVPISGGRS